MTQMISFAKPLIDNDGDDIMWWHGRALRVKMATSTISLPGCRNGQRATSSPMYIITPSFFLGTIARVCNLGYAEVIIHFYIWFQFIFFQLIFCLIFSYFIMQTKLFVRMRRWRCHSSYIFIHKKNTYLKSIQRHDDSTNNKRHVNYFKK